MHIDIYLFMILVFMYLFMYLFIDLFIFLDILFLTRPKKMVFVCYKKRFCEQFDVISHLVILYHSTLIVARGVDVKIGKELINLLKL